MNKKLMATAIAASTLGGAAAGAALLAPGQAGARHDSGPAVESSTTDPAARPEFGTRIAAALQGLVDDGTLTEDQVDAVIDALADARPDTRDGVRHRRHHGPRGHFFARVAGPEIAELLDMEPEELRDELRNGRTVADLAEARGVDIDTVIDALVDAAEERLGRAVDNGRLDAERADQMLDELEERLESRLAGGADA